MTGPCTGSLLSKLPASGDGPCRVDKTLSPRRRSRAGMRQPTKPLPNLRHRSAFGSLEHTDQLRALCTGWGLLATARSGRRQIGGRRCGFGT